MYELQDLLGKHIDGQFYAEELSPVTVTNATTYAINKNCIGGTAGPV